MNKFHYWQQSPAYAAKRSELPNRKQLLELSELSTTNTYQTCSSFYKSHEAKQCTLTQQSEESPLQRFTDYSFPFTFISCAQFGCRPRGAKCITVHSQCIFIVSVFSEKEASDIVAVFFVIFFSFFFLN